MARDNRYIGGGSGGKRDTRHSNLKGGVDSWGIT